MRETTAYPSERGQTPTNEQHYANGNGFVRLFA